MELLIKWIHKSHIGSWGTWFCKNIIIISTLKGLLFYTFAFCWRFHKILKFPQRQIWKNLHIKITFHYFYYFDNVLEDDALHNYSLKHSNRKWMIYYWKIGKIKGTVNFNCTVIVTVKIQWNWIIQLNFYTIKIIEDCQ